MSSDVRSIDVEDAPVDAAIIVERDMKPIQDLVEQALTRPAAIEVVHALPLPA